MRFFRGEGGNFLRVCDSYLLCLLMALYPTALGEEGLLLWSFFWDLGKDSTIQIATLVIQGGQYTIPKHRFDYYFHYVHYLLFLLPSLLPSFSLPSMFPFLRRVLLLFGGKSCDQGWIYKADLARKTSKGYLSGNGNEQYYGVCSG